ncbi:acyl-CoA dehydrogenase [Streptomyces sp. LD120]|uniref:Acyl-CoA dehydrogenase n=1 Tax=Streptomyces physcomitrii TaxID=2724184 RepID=A0ABX1H782_9ACTN|nr:acyl-CoA dehydrogenase family protein [Streptomyces physcomitrii]NKI42871.1 acyl-CoA dehydrogenase [Streptomyces physcomitrii]
MKIARPDDASPDGRLLRSTASARFAAWVADEAREMPLPGSGATRERFALLHDLGRTDLSLTRLAEGHADATAILHELGAPPPAPEERWGVWAAQPPGAVLKATQEGRGAWRLDGVKAFCSGAGSCTHALVTAETDAGRRLFVVDTGHPGCAAVAGSWQAVGMAGSDTPDVTFAAVPALPLGEVEAYTQRPGFWHGGVGVAACWLGGARGVAETLVRAVRRREPDQLTAAHLGAVDSALYSAECVLERAAGEIDADPADTGAQALVRAARTRAVVADVCARVLDVVGRALGAGPLCHDGEHAQRVADLGVYIRQHHAERDLAALGSELAGRHDLLSSSEGAR